MGLLARSARAPLRLLSTDNKAGAVATAIPTWDMGRPQQQPYDYVRGAHDGYLLDELVFACIDFRMDQTAEAPVCGYRRTAGGDEKIDEYTHPAIALLNRPNPFMGRSRLWKTTSMHLDIGGNAYWEKVRSAAGKVVELWPLRPDRMQVIPDGKRYIAGYKYTIGDRYYYLRTEDVIHFRNEHPLNDYYGLSRMAPLGPRIDLDVWQRDFISAFFRNAGVPFGLLNIERRVQPEERDMIRQQFRSDFSGRNAFSVGVIDGGAASYTAMGLPLGEGGIVLPVLDEMNETRICAVFQLTPSLIATRVGLSSSSYSNRASDREMFWDNVQVPRYRDLDATLTLGLQPDFPDLDRFEHDLSKVRALQEDEDKRHKRFRDDLAGQMITLQEARTSVGLPPEPDEPGLMFVSSQLVPTSSDDLLSGKMPAQPPDNQQPQAQPPAQPQNGRTNGVAAH